jgi:hypothetical protein
MKRRGKAWGILSRKFKNILEEGSNETKRRGRERANVKGEGEKEKKADEE